MSETRIHNFLCRECSNCNSETGRCEVLNVTEQNRLNKAGSCNNAINSKNQLIQIQIEFSKDEKNNDIPKAKQLERY